METVPPHFMGRVQNTFYFGGLMLQLVLGVTVGYVAHAHSLTVAFAIVGAVFGIAFLTSIWPVEKPAVPPTSNSREAVSQVTAEEARV